MVLFLLIVFLISFFCSYAGEIDFLPQSGTLKKEEDNSKVCTSLRKAIWESYLYQASDNLPTEELNVNENVKERSYQYAVTLMKGEHISIHTYMVLRDALSAMNGYKDSSDLAAKCQKEIELQQEKYKNNLKKI